MKKKILALVLALAMILTFAACGSSSPPAATQAPAAAPTEAPVEAPAEPEAPVLDYPTKNITWIVPVAAGSATDLVSRQVADMLDLGVGFAFENITGGSQSIGINEALTRDHDGHTIFSVANAGLLTQPIVNPECGYTVDDMIPVAFLAPDTLATIAVSNDSPIKTMSDWVDFVSSNEDFVFAVPAVGGFGHMTALAVLDNFGHLGKAVGYDSNPGAYQALLSGEVDFAVLDDNFVYNYYDQGTCNVVTTLYSAPSMYLPDVPALASEYDVDKLDALGGWKVLCLPADTDEQIVAFLKEKVDEVLLSAEYGEYLQASGYGSFNGKVLSIDEARGVVADAVALYAKILEEAGMM